MPHDHDVRRCKKCAAILALTQEWEGDKKLLPADIERHRNALSKKEKEALFKTQVQGVINEVWKPKRAKKR